MDLEQNITYRTSKPQRASSLDDLSRSGSALFDATMMSLPNTSLNESQTVIELNEKISELTNQLTSANHEIENLNTENFRLKSDLNKSLKLVETYKKLSLTDNTNLTPNRNSKSKAGKSTPRKETNSLQISHQATQTDHVISPVKISQHHESAGRSEEESLHCLQTQTKTSTPDMQNKTKTPTHNKQSKPINSITNPKRKQTLQLETSDCQICILSTNNNNKVRNIAETTLTKHSKNICHYVMPNCKTEQLLCDIENKLKDFTYHDFCIILIGEEDFNSTKDYFQLVLYIRTALQKTTHTNVILCSPTYNFNDYKTMYNWRVELFNNLLYLDTLTHEHAYFLDSNKNLSNDYTMFSKRSGLLNNFGMHTIFKDIDNFIQGLKTYDIFYRQTDIKELNQTKERNQLFL